MSRVAAPHHVSSRPHVARPHTPAHAPAPAAPPRARHVAAAATAATTSPPAVPSQVNAPVTTPELLLNSAVALPRLVAAIGAATSVIDISMYGIIDSGSGSKLGAALIAAASRGVEVNLMVDGRGSMQIPLTKHVQFIERLRAAGVHVIVNDSLVPVVDGPVDHCKAYCIDGQTGFLGGMNLSATYDKWHDAMMTLGPASAIAAGRDFLEKWTARGGTISARNRAALFPTTMPAADPRTTVLANHPGQQDPITQAYLGEIAGATRRIWVESPFLGSQAMVDALCAAARRGVDVRLLTDGVKTHDAVPGITLIGESYYKQLTDAGVHVYQQAQMTHSKVLLADDRVTAGSFNLTTRSAGKHFEIDVQTSVPAFVGQVDAMFGADLATAHEVTAADEATLGNRLLTLVHDVFGVQY